jgi:hypothetical protein
MKNAGVFALNKDLVISADPAVSDESVKNIPIIWIGKESNCHIDVKQDVKDALKILLDNLEKFHGPNFEAALLLIGWLHVALNVEDMNSNELNIAALQLIGHCNEGKSTLLRHLATMLPYLLNVNNHCERMKDNNFTVAKLKKLLSKTLIKAINA